MNMHAWHQAGTEGASGYLTIDLAALRENYLTLKSLAPSSVTGAVVKADAYGLGADRVVPVLYQAGCRHFFVAVLHEALRLRPLLPKDAQIFVLNGLQPGNEPLCAQMDIVPVLNSLEQIARWSKQAVLLGRSLPAALQTDSGMSRLGLAPDELRELAATPSLLEGIQLEMLMSHLACADEPENDANAEQLAAMQAASDLLAGNVPVCFANSGGIFLGSAYHNHMLRPGIALYGGAPSEKGANRLKPVVRLDVAVIQTRSVPAGTRIGYGGALVAANEMRLATISAGYADGLPRSLSNSGSAWFDGIRLPFAGRVSMDSIILDISALPAGTLKNGSLVEIIGPHQSLEDVAEDAGTIAYEILTGLGARYHREYLYPAALPCPQSEPVRQS